MKFFVLLFFISCSTIVGQGFLYALEDWFQPEIHSIIYQSFNQDPVIPQFHVPSYERKTTQFAVSSIKMTELSIRRFLSVQDSLGIMFRYSPNYPSQDLNIRIFGGFDYHLQDGDYYFFPYKGLKVFASVSKDITLNGYWWAGQFRGDKKYYLTSPLIDGFYQKDGNVIYFDNLEGSLKYDTDRMQLSLGRGKFQVGDNISGSIILNNAANDYGYFSSKFQFGKLSLSYLHGALTPDKHEVVYYLNHDPGSVDSSRVDKFLVMHKLDWQPSSNFSGFLGEEIIYGDRSLDLNYLMPHAFWRIIEHNTEDRDNVLIFGGLNWKINKQLSFYENTLFDEFSQDKVLTDWWGNKYALQAGLSYLISGQMEHNPSIKREPRVTLEMTAVRPWTYTHFIKWNKFSNDGLALGFPVGSNCLNYSVETDFPILHRLFIGVNGSYSRQGSVGNRFDLNTTDPELIPDQENTKTRWLAGNIANTKSIRLMAEWIPLEHHFIRLGTILEQVQESDWTKELILSYRTEF